MAISNRVLASNRLAKSEHYGKILKEYNERYTRDGMVNQLKFYTEIVKPLVPNYSQRAWYQFVNRFKTGAGLIAFQAAEMAVSAPVDPVPGEKTLLSNTVATATLIQSILNIGAERAQQILENPSLLTAKEAVELSLKGMKAQDSRIHAIGKIREDSREQEKFDRAFDGANYDA